MITRIFESLLEESGKKRFIKKWLPNEAEKVEEYDKIYEEFAQIFDNEVKKRGLNWQTSMTLEIFEEILEDVKDRKSKTEIKKQNKAAGKSDFLSYVLTNPDCDLTYLGTLCKWDYFKINTWPGAMLADSPKSSLKGDTGAKWCIGWKDPAKQKFDEYTRDGLDFVLIVKSDSSNTDKEEKYCIQIVRETGLVEGIWTPIDDLINSKEKIGKILYKQEFKTLNKKLSGILKGIDIGIKDIIQPENKIVDLGTCEPEEDDLIGGKFYYNLYKSGTDQLIDRNSITTLEFIDLKPLPKWFFHLVKLDKIEKIIFPEGLRAIGEKYFYSDYSSRYTILDNIKHIEIPDSVEVIGDFAFRAAFKNLESIKLPANLRKIGVQSFNNCISLKHVELPDSVEEIGENAFSKCENLESVKLPANLKVFDKCCFSHCKSLKYIEIPDSVEEISDYTFYECHNLESVKLPANLKKIGEYCFKRCKNLKHIEIPDSIEVIGDCAFDGCFHLSIKLPANLKKIGKRCFTNCIYLKHIEIPESIEVIGEYTFNGCDSLESVKLPANLKIISEQCFSYCESLKRIEIPDSVEEIGKGAFGACYRLESVKMSANLKKIGEQCFNSCKNLRHIEIPDSVEEIGDYAFYNTGITDRVLINKIKSIKSKA